MDCDLALHDIALALLTYPATWHLNGDHQPQRISRSAHPLLVPFQLFKGGDDEGFVVACAKEKFWRRFVDVVDRLNLTGDPRFSDFAARLEHRDALVDLLDEAFVRRSAAEWVAAFETAGVPAAPVQSVPEALADPQVTARRLLVDVPHERFGAVRQLASPFRASGLDEGEYRRAPARGEHEVEILKGILGYDNARIKRVREGGGLG